MFACTFNKKSSTSTSTTSSSRSTRSSIDGTGLFTADYAKIDYLDVKNIDICGMIIPSNNNVDIGTNINRFNTVYTYDLCCNTVNGISSNNIGTGVDRQFVEEYFRYFFVEKPLAPVYITGGSFSSLDLVIPPIRIQGTFDKFSGKFVYNSDESQYIELDWINPPQKEVVFNYPTSYQTDNGALYKLPYRKHLYLEYLQNPKTASADIWGINQSERRIVLNLDDSSKTIQVSLSNDATFRTGIGTTVRFRIFFTNFDLNVDNSHNYLYFPGNSFEDWMSIGGYGKASRPTSIYIQDIGNYKLSIYGYNGQNMDVCATDQIIRTFTQLESQKNDIELYVKYGFNLIINELGLENITSKQYFKPAPPYNFSNSSISYESKHIIDYAWNME